MAIHNDFEGIISSQEDSLYMNLNTCSTVLIDDISSKELPIFEDIRNTKQPVNMIICLKNKDFYELDFVGVLGNYLETTKYTQPLIDRIIAASQEAYSNAFLWSSLDLESYEGIRAYEFYGHVEQRIQDPLYRDRLLCTYLKEKNNLIEIAFFVQGRPIKWPEKSKGAKFRGTSIMVSQTDNIQIDKDGKAIRLFFKVI